MSRPGGAAAVARRLAARSAALGALQALAIAELHHDDVYVYMYIIMVILIIIIIRNNNNHNT